MIFADITLSDFNSLDTLMSKGAEYYSRLDMLAAKPTTIRVYQDEILDRLEKWAVWHTERGEFRGMQRGEGWHGLHALEALATAVADLGELSSDASDDAVDAAIAAVHTDVSVAKLGADLDRQHNGEAFAQCVEVEETSLRQLLRTWVDIDLIRRAARDGQLPADRALQVAAEMFVFGDVPEYPPGEDV